MRQWKSKIMAFDRGLDTTDAINAGPPHFEDLQNIQFGRRGELRTRPGVTTVAGFSRRGLTVDANPTDVALSNLADTGYLGATMNTARSAVGEVPLLITRGRAYTYETTSAGSTTPARWSDRLGVLQARWDYVGSLRQGVTSTATPFSTDTALGLATAFDFGPGPGGAATFGGLATVTRLTENSAPETGVTLAKDFTRGNGAAISVSGAYASAVVYVESATNNLRIAGHGFGSATFTEATIATDALAGTGMRGAPVICADYDTQSWFVAYWTTTTRVFKVLKVNSAFTVTATYTAPAAVLAGSERGIWVTNSSVADNKVVVAVTTSTGAGVLTRVLNHALADQAIDVTTAHGLTSAAFEVVTVGVAESGQVWGASVNNAGVAANTGELVVFRRSTSAATLTTYNAWAGDRWGQAAGGFANNSAKPFHFLVHQPIKVGARVLIGTGAASPIIGPAGPGTGAGQVYTACRWYVSDITDLFALGTTTGTVVDPVMAGRSELECVPFMGPRAAVLDPANSNHYRFPVVTWDDVAPVLNTSYVSHYASPGVYTGSGSYTHRLVDFVLEPQQVGNHRGGVVIGGAIPRALTAGYVQPVGFPWQGAPGMTVTPGAGAGAYSLAAVWAHTDESGQVHRSAPSEFLNVTSAAFPMTCVITAPQFSERDTSPVYVEIYCTDINPSANAPHYLVGRSPVLRVQGAMGATTSVVITGINTKSETLYTDGNVFANRQPAADGGVASVGDRTWISDGRAVIASKLGAVGGREAPAWNDDGPLRLELPTSAGRVVALSGIDDKLLIFCTGGVWALNGDGPDDTGQGLEYRSPQKISDVGTTDPRSVVQTSRGTFYVAANTHADGSNETGGIWLVDRSLTASHVSRALDGFPQNLSLITEGAYLPERESLVYCDSEQVRLYVLDLRENKWVKWTRSGDFPVSVSAVAGLLWGAGVTNPLRFDRVSGTDGADGVGGGTSILMSFTTSHVPIGADPLRRGRLRSVTPLVRSTDPVTLDDVFITIDDSVGASVQGTVFTPGTYDGPEIFSSVRQKGHVVQVDMQFSGVSTIQLAGLRFMYKDEPGFPATVRAKAV